MPQDTESKKKAASRVKLPKDLALLPPVSMDDLKKDIEHDPEGAQEFVALIRALRQTESPPVTL